MLLPHTPGAKQVGEALWPIGLERVICAGTVPICLHPSHSSGTSTPHLLLRVLG